MSYSYREMQCLAVDVQLRCRYFAIRRLLIDSWDLCALCGALTTVLNFYVFRQKKSRVLYGVEYLRILKLRYF